MVLLWLLPLLALGLAETPLAAQTNPASVDGRAPSTDTPEAPAMIESTPSQTNPGLTQPGLPGLSKPVPVLGEPLGIPPEAAGGVGSAGLSSEDYLSLFRRKWFERQRVLESGSEDASDHLLKSLGEIRLDLGVRNLLPYSLALVEESQTARQAHQKKRMLLLAQSAAQLSPDYPPIYFYLAKTQFLSNVLNIDDYLTSLWNGVRGQVTNPIYLLRHVANGVTYLMIAIVLCIVVGLLLIVIKYTGLLAHVLKHIFILAYSPTLGKILILIMICLPMFLHLGFGWLILICCLLYLPFVKPAERFFLNAVAILVLALPIIIPRAAGLITARSEHAYLYFLAMGNELSPGDLERLSLIQKYYDPKGMTSYALGFIYKKRGAYQTARFYDERAEAQGFSKSATQTNLGNVAFAEGKPEAAISYYQSALKTDPVFFYAYYNLAQAYFEIKDIKRGSESYAKAKEINSRLEQQHSAVKTNHMNRLVGDVPLEFTDIAQRLLEPSALKEELASAYWNAFFRPFSAENSLAVSLAYVSLAILATLLPILLTLPTNCVKCGIPACQWCFATLKKTDLCSQCFNIFGKKESVDPVARDNKEIEISRYQRREKRLVHWLSLLIPGSGHFYLGKTMRGAVLVVIFSVLALLAIFWQGVFVPPLLMGNSNVGRIAIVLPVGIIFYYFIFRNVHQD